MDICLIPGIQCRNVVIFRTFLTANEWCLDFVTKEIPIPAETMDREMQTDESCFDDNGYLPIVGKPPGRLQ